MQSLLLYLFMLIVGAFIGSRFLSPEKEYKWIGRGIFIAIVVLVLAVGIRIGANEQVFASIGEIGLAALVITVFTVACSMLAVTGARKLLGIDRKGVRTSRQEEEQA